MAGKFHFAIDRGGTFTDIWCLQPDGSIRQLKLLSEDVKNYSDAPREGIRRIMEDVNIYSQACAGVKTGQYVPICKRVGEIGQL